MSSCKEKDKDNGQSVPNLPERFRRGPRLEASSSTAAASSSTVPAPKARPSSEEGVTVVGHSTVRITRSNPLLRTSRPSPQPVPNRVQYRDPSQREISWLQLQVIDGQSSLTNSQAVISWDHHLVLDTLRVSSRNVVKASAGEYPRAVKDVLAIVHGLPSNIAQIVCSYCHRDDTVQNVIQCASNQTEFAKIFITRKPTGEQGKLAVLRSHFSLSTVLIHVDDSPEVLGACANLWCVAVYHKFNLHCIYIYIHYIQIYIIYIYTHYIHYIILYIFVKVPAARNMCSFPQTGGTIGSTVARWSRSCSDASFTEAIEAITSRPFEATGSCG